MAAIMAAHILTVFVVRKRNIAVDAIGHPTAVIALQKT